MNNKRLLMISTDRLIFDEKSNVRRRQIEYAKDWEKVHIIVFSNSKLKEKNLVGDPEPTSSKFQTLSSNCFVYGTESKFKLMYPFDATKLGRQIITEHQITDITCQDASLTAMAGVSLKKQFSLPLEIQIHEDLGSPYYTYNFTNNIRKVLAKKYLLEADKIRVVSKRVKEYVEKVLDDSIGRNLKKPEIEIRPIVVDTNWIHNSPIIVDLHKKYLQFGKIVLMASRLEKEKNIEIAIHAWLSVIESNPNAGLVIVGKGSEEANLKKLIQNLGLEKNIIMENWVDKETLASYYKTADIFLNTSLFEGYGMTLIEAKAAGCLIISTDVGIAKEVGAVITGLDASELATKIIQVLSK